MDLPRFNRRPISNTVYRFTKGNQEHRWPNEPPVTTSNMYTHPSPVYLPTLEDYIKLKCNSCFTPFINKSLYIQQSNYFWTEQEATVKLTVTSPSLGGALPLRHSSLLTHTVIRKQYSSTLLRSTKHTHVKHTGQKLYSRTHTYTHMIYYNN